MLISESEKVKKESTEIDVNTKNSLGKNEIKRWRNLSAAERNRFAENWYKQSRISKTSIFHIKKGITKDSREIQQIEWSIQKFI